MVFTFGYMTRYLFELFYSFSFFFLLMILFILFIFYLLYARRGKQLETFILMLWLSQLRSLTGKWILTLINHDFICLTFKEVLSIIWRLLLTVPLLMFFHHWFAKFAQVLWFASVHSMNMLGLSYRAFDWHFWSFLNAAHTCSTHCLLISWIIVNRLLF